MIFINKKTLKAILILILCVCIGAGLVTPVKKKIYPLKYSEIIKEQSEKYQLDPYLVMAVISTESRFRENASSHRGAKGLMQITEETAKWCVEKFEIQADSKNIYQPRINIEIGCAYLEFLIELFDGKTETALAAYNAGQGNVSLWLNDKKYSADGKTLTDIPFPETKEYVEKVLKRYEIYKKLY